MILAVFVAYLLFMAGIGLYCSRFNKDIGDFVLGGRRLGPWVAAFSAQASDFSGWLLIGLPAAAYAGGFSMIWTCIGCSLGVMFNWLVLAPRLRIKAEQYGALTIPDFLEAQFNDRTHIVRIVTVITILLFYATYISAQFIAAGKVFDTVFVEVGMPWGQTATWSYYRQGLLIGAVIILGYTAIGGFLAVCWTDFVQAILMIAAVVVLPIVGISRMGGLEALWTALASAAENDIMLAVDNGKTGASFTFGVVLAGLAWGVGYPGQPHIAARFMAIRDPRKIPQSALISVTWTLFALYGSMFVGLVALGVLGPELAANGSADRAMPMLALELLPPLVAGIVLSAAVAAMMSTVDSQLIVAVAAVVRDGYEKLLGGHPSGTVAVWLSRAVLIGMGTGGVALAWGGKSVFDTVLDAWSGLAAGLGPAIVLGCLWKDASRNGVIVGMIAGVLLTQFWGSIMGVLTEAGGTPAAIVPHLNAVKLIVCVGVNLLLTVLISLASPPSRVNR